MAEPSLDPCECCEGVEPLTPVSRINSPGLRSLMYRVGTHASFKQTMLAKLVTQIPKLTIRENDDGAIALLDAGATMLDVLTFYQERIANEGYLGTATERLSVRELARAIGYELNPGVAATTYLAFSLESASSAPAAAAIPVGTRVQSLPGQDETPQTFETIAAISARVGWNQLKPRLTELRIPSFGATSVRLKGIATGLKPGDGILFIGAERERDLGSERWDFRLVKTVKTFPEQNYTEITWEDGLGWRRGGQQVLPAQENFQVYALRQRVALFGHNAPDWRVLSNEVRNRYLPARDSETNQAIEWSGLTISAIASGLPVPALTSGIGLFAEYHNDINLTQPIFNRIDATVDFDWGTNSPAPSISADRFSVRWTGRVQAQFTETYTFYTNSDDGVQLWVNGSLIIDNWTNHPPREDSGTIDLTAGQRYSVRLEYYENGGGSLIQLAWSSPRQPRQIIPQDKLYPPLSQTPAPPTDLIFLDALYPQIVERSWLVLSTATYEEVYRVSAVAEDSRKGFTLTAKTTRIQVEGENLDLFDGQVRNTVVFAQSEPLELAEVPITESIQGDRIILNQRLIGEDIPQAGQPIAIVGKDATTGETISQVVTLVRTELDGTFTRLIFSPALQRSYQRESVTLNANVAKATHGETKQEVLGSGDGSQPFQTFQLKQLPLTYISAATTTGASSTLELRVNDILWDEVETFYGSDRRQRIYTTQITEDGKVTVQFGDGTTGARLPSGNENIRAIYRVGIGQAGMVQTGQLSLLMTRPLGVQSVINPVAPTGAANPESRDEARQSAPVTVLTLGRIVSLQDFADFARAFAGIGKAQAIWVWERGTRLVHLTIAAAVKNANGNYRVGQDSDLYRNLRQSMDAARDAIQPLRIESYQPLTFKLKLGVKVDRRYPREAVLNQITSQLQHHFAFEQRTFGQSVTAGEILALVQGVEGVIAADAVELYLTGQSPQFTGRLDAQPARWDNTSQRVIPAELLTLAADGVVLTEMEQ